MYSKVDLSGYNFEFEWKLTTERTMEFSVNQITTNYYQLIFWTICLKVIQDKKPIECSTEKKPQPLDVNNEIVKINYSMKLLLYFENHSKWTQGIKPIADKLAFCLIVQ